MLADPARCQVILVTLPETTPVNEAVETAYALEERVGVHLGPVVVNGVDHGPALPAGCRPRGQPDAPRGRVPQRPPLRCTTPSATASPTSSPSRNCTCRPLPARCLDAASIDIRLAVDDGERVVMNTIDAPPATLAEHLATAEVLVCCGSGGVGKTTVAAALGLEAALLGRRAVVVTIDPAKRLADALGRAGRAEQRARSASTCPATASCGR